MNLDIILLDEKSYKNDLIYNILRVNLFVRLDKIDGFIRVYDGTRYLVLFGTEKHDFIYNRITHLIVVKSGITYNIYQNCAKIKVDSYESVLLEKAITFLNVLKLIKSVFYKDKSNYYYNLFLAKSSYELPKK